LVVGLSEEPKNMKICAGACEILVIVPSREFEYYYWSNDMGRLFLENTRHVNHFVSAGQKSLQKRLHSLVTFQQCRVVTSEFQISASRLTKGSNFISTQVLSIRIDRIICINFSVF
jgi:hypothetical protein